MTRSMIDYAHRHKS